MNFRKLHRNSLQIDLFHNHNHINEDYRNYCDHDLYMYGTRLNKNKEYNSQISK